MKKILIIIVGIMMFTIFSSFLSFLFDSGMSPKKKMVSKITRELSGKFKKKYDLNFMGISEAADEGKYKIVGMELNCKKILSKDEGRRLLLQCAQDTLDALNSYPQFRQYMINYPFTGKNIIVHIYSKPPKNFDVYHPDIAVFLFYNDILSYKTNSPQNSFEYFTKEKETLEEAKKIVASQQSKGHKDLE
jgi:hypothetical protein